MSRAEPKWRILAIVAEAYGRSGGIAQFNRNLIDALAARDDVELRVLGLFGSATPEAPRRVTFAVPAPGNKIGFALEVVRRSALWRPDLILNGTVGFGPLALAAKGLARAKLWTTSHGVDVWQPGARLDNAGLRRSELVTTVSEYTRSRLREWSGIPADRVRLLHNTIDLHRFTPGRPPRELVERYGVAGEKVLLTVGRLSVHERYKGQDRVIGVLGELRRSAGPVRYIVAGSGDDRPRLERLAREKQVSDLVTFAGFVPDEEIQDHYRLADVFVMPSTGEGFGIVFLEAMACGCPVIAGNRDGSVDALAHGELGRLVDPDSPEELLRALRATLAEERHHDRAIPGLERFAVPRFRERVDELIDALRQGRSTGRA
jgi:glycosyltransferase involved in cell wall biosynthesis